MKKFILSFIAALVGICLAIVVHCSFLIVKEQSGSMLPSIEPGQRVIVYLLTKNEDIQVGDIVAYESPYYVVDGENGILLRRVIEMTSDELILSCDANMTKDEYIKISKDEILGKVIVL